jgi:purine-cytosine permease-like protein
MLLRKCPVCNKTVTPVNLLGPGFSAEAGPVICKHCNSTISEPMQKYQGLGGIGMLIGFLIGRVIVKPLFGNSVGLDRLFAELGIGLIVIFVIFTLIYEFLPLKEITRGTSGLGQPE